MFVEDFSLEYGFIAFYAGKLEIISYTGTRAFRILGQQAPVTLSSFLLLRPYLRPPHRTRSAANPLHPARTIRFSLRMACLSTHENEPTGKCGHTEGKTPGE